MFEDRAKVDADKRPFALSEELMKHFIKDYDEIVKTRSRALPYMLEAHRRMWEPDVGVNRFISRTR